jgi:hypothetical protein
MMVAVYLLDVGFEVLLGEGEAREVIQMSGA